MRGLVLTLLVVSASLFSSERVESELENVQLISIDLLTDEEVYYGKTYYAQNLNGHEIEIVIRLTNSVNAIDELPEETIKIPTKERARLGSVRQDHPGLPAGWVLEWGVRKQPKD